MSIAGGNRSSTGMEADPVIEFRFLFHACKAGITTPSPGCIRTMYLPGKSLVETGLLIG
jgi:hypothetical protein